MGTPVFSDQLVYGLLAALGFLAVSFAIWVSRPVGAEPVPRRAACGNVAVGLAHNGDLIVLSSGWGYKPGYRDRRLPPWVCRSSDGGSTCAFLDDYDEICPYSGSTSGDVVYSYTPGANGTIDVSICNSAYDTKTYVYENSSATLVACNDDGCGSDGFKSELTSVPVTAGNTYYIVVDGYFGDCGTYDLQVSAGAGPCMSSGAMQPTAG